jgi:hypothetical protein
VNAFGVDDGTISKKGLKALKPLKGMIKGGKFGNAGGMFGERTAKNGQKLPSAFRVGQKRGFTEGLGPIASAGRGLEYAAAHSPGTAAAAGTGAVGALGGSAYLMGRSHKKSDG